MSGDYKWDIQCIAEEMAEELYEKEFYDLTNDQQYEVFLKAERRYVDRMADHADYLRKREREGR